MPEEKLRDLIDVLRGMDSILLAYSGGLDSTFLLKAATLSGVRAVAVTARSETTPPHDLRDASSMARELGVEHVVMETGEMEEENFLMNPPDRCYYCKDILFRRLKALAGEMGLSHVIDGSNLDDTSDYRPGRKAAEEQGVRSPLIEAGFGKAEIRESSRALGLPLWEKPASPCLSSRIPYGTRITKEALRRVREAEEFLRALGFRELRVRHYGGMARLEVPEGEIDKAVRMRGQVVQHLKGLGYDFVCLDLEGLRSGSLNRGLR
jgi:uncharacterized protein